MRLNYNGFISVKIDSKFQSNRIFTDISQTEFASNYKAIFTFVPNRENIFSQARAFARKFSSIGKFEYSFLDNAARLGMTVEELITEAYVYSYFCSIYRGVCSSLTNKVQISAGNGYVFIGHKIMHDLLVRRFAQDIVTAQTSLDVTIKSDKGIRIDLESWPEFEKWYDPMYDCIFDEKCETVLNFIKRTSNNMVAMISLDSPIVNEAIDLNISPLGNSCYSEDQLVINHIEIKELTQDVVSLFWGIATGLTVLDIDSVDADDEIYDTILTDKIDSRTIGFQVQSITGFNPFRYVRPSRQIQIRGRGGAPSDSGSGGASNSGGTGPNPTNRGNQNPTSPGSNPGGGSGPERDPSVLDANVVNKFKNNSRRTASIASRLTDGAANIVSQVNEVINDRNIRTIASVLSNLAGTVIRERQLRNYKGQRVQRLLDDFGLYLDERDTQEVYIYIDEQQKKRITDHEYSTI